MSDYWDDGDGTVLTDNKLTDGWYTAVYNGWQYLLVDSNDIPEYERCSTLWPVYLKGNTIKSVKTLKHKLSKTKCRKKKTIVNLMLKSSTLN